MEGIATTKYKPPSSNAQAAFFVMRAESTINSYMLRFASRTYPPVTTLIMATASTGINAGNSDVSAPTMKREQSGPAHKGESVRAHSDDATQTTQLANRQAKQQ